MLSDAARTAQQAADGLGVQLGQIAKSIVFRRLADDAPVLVVTSGDRRVDSHKVEKLVGALGRADAEFVKNKTGFSIGGVSPVAHATPVVTLVDVDLFRFDTVWAAAGHPHAVFPSSPAQLCALVGVAPDNVVEGVSAQMPNEIRERLTQRAAAVRNIAGTGAAIPSPCVSVCNMDAEKGLCRGCLRSLDEIRVWSVAGEAEKLAVWQCIEARLGASAA